MSVLHFNAESFQKAIAGSAPVLIDFWAEWCGPCKMLGPIVDQVADELDGQVVVGKVNVDDSQDLAAEYGIMSIPTLLYFKDGQLVDKMVGVKPKEEIIDFLNLK